MDLLAIGQGLNRRFLEPLPEFYKRRIIVWYQAPCSLSALLNNYMASADISVEELAFASKISERTIGAMRNKADYRPKLKNLISICIGLHLKPSYSYRLLEVAGDRLTCSYRDTIYKYILDNLYMYDIGYSNSFLIKANLKPL